MNYFQSPPPLPSPLPLLEERKNREMNIKLNITTLQAEKLMNINRRGSAVLA
jgi:hypothetical protein